MQPTLTAGAEGLEIRWADGTIGSFPYLWLRDTDPAGFHPQTGERTFDLTSVALDLTARHAAIESGELVVAWPDISRKSRFDLEWIKANRPGCPRPDAARVTPVIWRRDLGAEGVPRAVAEDIITSDSALAGWLRETKRYGLSIVTGLADSADAGMDVARRVGHLRETNFGLTFEVMSKPDPNNLAYTSDALPLHTDLTNQDLPPGYQFLHCLANEAEGGGSVFCDGRAVAEDLKVQDSEAFDILSTLSVPFRFHDAETDIRSRKTVVTLDDAGEVTEVCFNAHLADILDLPADRMTGFYRAYRTFMEMTRDPAYGVTLKLRGGEMVVFDNRRVLHGREAFDPSTGFRHLHGCYVDRGEWDSRLRVVSRAISTNVTAKKPGS